MRGCEELSDFTNEGLDFVLVLSAFTFAFLENVSIWIQ